MGTGRRNCPRCALSFSLLFAALALRAPAQSARNPFFVFDNGLHSADLGTIGAKLDLVKKIGFDGLSWRVDDASNFLPTPGSEAPRPGNDPVANFRQLLDGASRRGLRVYVLYCSLDLKDGGMVYDPRLPQFIELCRGRGVMLWPNITSSQFSPSSVQGDPVAVAGLRRLADAAAANGVQIALYPHVGLWLQNVDDAVRVIHQVDRANLGLTFNLCHALLDHEDARIGPVIEAAAPYLLAATINGADGGVAAGDNKRAIQTLDRGTFDVGAVVRKLRSVGFQGPIGLQCYQVEGDPAETLVRSFGAWRRISSTGP